MGRGGSPTLSIALISVPFIYYIHIVRKRIYSLQHNSSKQPPCSNSQKRSRTLDVCSRGQPHRITFLRGKKSLRAISTARLNMLPCLHLQPINVVVYNDPQGKSNLVVGFALRCFQRLSRPDADTQRCPWRNNRYTGGRSITVLSY